MELSAAMVREEARVVVFSFHMTSWPIMILQISMSVWKEALLVM